MKNIEKYPSTKGALDAYNSLASKTVSFDAWLVCEYKEPHAPTLVEAANAATKAWFLHFPGDALVLTTEAIYNLFSTIEREKPEPCPFCGKEVVRRTQPRVPCGRSSEERRYEMNSRKHETVADIVAGMRECSGRMEKRGLYDLRECGTDYLRALADLIKAEHKREIAELDRKAREANLKYRAEKARHTDTYKDARIKAQDEETATLKREVAELRECLGQAYGDKTGTYTMKGNEVERWRKALCEKGETK